MQQLGIYHYPKSAQTCPALFHEQANGHFVVTRASDQSVLWQGNSVHTDEVISGLPVTIELSNGGLFIYPANQELPISLKRRGWLATLEFDWRLVMLAVLGTPLFCLWIYFDGIPRFAHWLTPAVPDSVSQWVDQQSLITLDKALLEPSQLPIDTQKRLTQQWQHQFGQLPDLPVKVRSIEFRDGGKMAANAFALPGGTIVVTDQLVTLLEHQPEALLSVLLHELGHVEQQHGMQMLTRSATTAVVLALIFGDLSSLNDAIIGTATSLAQAKFSQNFEREADQYSLQALKTLAIPRTAFADALRALQQQHAHQGEDPEWLKLLSSHPALSERIDTAEHAD